MIALAGAELGLGGGTQLHEARHEEQICVVPRRPLRRHHRLQLPEHLAHARARFRLAEGRISDVAVMHSALSS